MPRATGAPATHDEAVGAEGLYGLALGLSRIKHARIVVGGQGIQVLLISSPNDAVGMHNLRGG